MAATVYSFPASPESPPQEAPGLNLSPSEVQEAAGGYQRAADQLRELHRRGFVRAYIPTMGRKRVILERAHYDAVVRGQYRQAEAANEPQGRPAPRANRDRLVKFFRKERK